jgi:hypothetical protein
MFYDASLEDGIRARIGGFGNANHNREDMLSGKAKKVKRTWTRWKQKCSGVFLRFSETLNQHGVEGMDVVASREFTTGALK